MIEFGNALRYPWNNPKRLWNILWMLIPILGALAVVGYMIKIIKTIVAGDVSGLPEFGDFFENLKNGLMLIIKAIPLMIVFWILALILVFIPVIGWLALIAIEVFILPWLFINLVVKGDVAASFDISSASNVVFKNIAEYLMALVKTIAYMIIYGLLSVVLIGIPCLYFGQHLFLAEFYANYKA